MRIPASEFQFRIENIQKKMIENNIDIFLIYGDEYRKEHLRYVSNHWPMCDMGLLAIGKVGEPILLVAPETEGIAKEMSVWSDIRLLKEMEMPYVNEKIEYTVTNKYTTLTDVFYDLSKGKKINKIWLCGFDAISIDMFKKIKSFLPKESVIEEADNIIYEMRIVKSQAEIEILKKAGEICDMGYKAVLDSNIVGMTERQVVGIGEKAARDAGAEVITFSIFASGEERTNAIIPRATEKIVEKGDLIMYSLATQYEGYIASNAWPFVAGFKPTTEQLDLIKHIIKSENIGIKSLKTSVVAGEIVKKIRQYFISNRLVKYDIYPPIHGVGLAEAESPYPDQHADYIFLTNMAINFDVGLFGIPGFGSNRIEEGYIIGENNLISISKLINKLREDFLSKN